MEDLLNAARLGDPLSHTAAMYGFWAGLAIGLVVAVAIIGTGGLAAPAIIGAVMLLGAGGGLLGESIYSIDASRAVTGAITSGSPNVFINDKPAARAHIDKGLCNRDSPVPQIIAQGSCSVFINGRHAARKSDAMTCGALINDGSPNVFIGGDKFTTDDISPEVPTWLNNTLMVVAFAGATILLGPAVAILGLTFSVIGGEGGKVLSHLFGFKKGSDGEKWFQIAGSILGGAAGGKLGGGLPKGVVVADEVVPPENEIIPDADIDPKLPIKPIGESANKTAEEVLNNKWGKKNVDKAKELKKDNPKLDNLLSDDEFISINAYTSDLYVKINPALRSGDPGDWQVVSDATSSGLGKMAENGYAYKGTVTRGMTLNDQQVSDLFPEDGTFQDNAPLSTSSKVSNSFDGNVRVTIESENGVQIKSLSKYPHETEVLFKPKTQFNVASKTFNSVTNQWEIELSEK